MYVTIELRDQEDELAVAIVFRTDRRRAPSRSKAPCRCELIRSIPAQEITHNTLVPESQQCLGGQAPSRIQNARRRARRVAAPAHRG